MGPRLDPIGIVVLQEQPGCKGIGDSVWMCEAHSFCEKGLIYVRPISVCIANVSNFLLFMFIRCLYVFDKIPVSMKFVAIVIW